MLNAIQTGYKGKTYKSRLEGDIARIIDRLGYVFEYEPISFLLPSGLHYWPDFYVPDIHLWIEGRGYESEKGQNQIDEFSRLINEGYVTGKTITAEPDFGHDLMPFEELNKRDAPDYLVIKYDSIQFTEYRNRFGYGSSNDSIALARCGRCHKYYFMGPGSYQCRICGTWEGNSHIDKMNYFGSLEELKEIVK